MNSCPTPRSQHDDDGWALPILMLLAVIALAVWILVQLATATSYPSVALVETATIQLAGQADSAVQPNAYVTCTYDATSWTPGQRFTCSVWQPTVDGPLPHLAQPVDTAVLVVQSVPSGGSGHYVSVHFASGAGPYLVNLDNVLSTSSALASSHYALARA